MLEPECLRVLVVDDHDLFRCGMASLLGADDGVEIVGQASGGRAGVRLAAELKPDVVLMDLRMPDLGGAEATRAIVNHDPEARVVVLTVASGEADVAAAIEAGACGFVAKDTPVENVLAAIRAAVHGAAWLCPRAAEVILSRVREAESATESAPAATEALSPREVEVLRLLARGLENAEIAAELHISPRTAKNHVSNILSKLGLPGRVQAAIFAVRQGLN